MGFDVEVSISALTVFLQAGILSLWKNAAYIRGTMQR